MLARALGLKEQPADIVPAPSSIDHYSGELLSKDISIHSQPFPYFVLDQAIPQEMHEGMLEYWPEESIFNCDRTDGCALIGLTDPKIWDKFTPKQKDYWHKFSYECVPDMLRRSMLIYGKKAYQKYGDWLKEVIVYQINITEAFKPIQYLNIHHHHINSPTFIGTCIYYVDDWGHTTRGTTIHGLKKPIDIEQYVDLSSSLTFEERAELEFKTQVEFHNNRLLSISDSPISFHAVPDRSDINVKGPRKMLTIQWGAPSRWLEERYGLNEMEHHEARKHLPLEKKVRSILKEDLETFLTPIEVDAPTYHNWLRTLQVKSAGALQFMEQPLFV